jgi:hypothetical protein
LNYSRIYDELISDRRANPPNEDEYYEVHHIVPRCMGGGDEPENLVKLRPGDHFFAHLLLAKTHGGRLWAAVHLMAGARLRGTHYLAKEPRTLARKRYARLSALARKKQVGANHPTSDKSVYEWENVDGRSFSGTRIEFKTSVGAKCRGVDNVLTGYAKSAMGWFVPSLLGEEDLKLFRTGGKRKERDQSIHVFKHEDGRQFEGTRRQFKEYSGVKRTMVDRLVLGGCYTASGWHIPALNPTGIDGKHFYSGDRAGTAIKKVFHFMHTTGEEYIGTRMGLVERYGLNRQAVHNMAKGVSATSGGWFMMDGDKPAHPANDNIANQMSLPLTA